MIEKCPCGSRRALADCCGPVIGGAEARTAETLMRSRFTAFVLAEQPYLVESWHPDTRPADLEIDPEMQWRRLPIVQTIGGGPAETTGVVEFRASYRRAGEAGLLHERSRFVRHDGRWVYLDGVFPDE